jgi:hypothetical protein
VSAIDTFVLAMMLHPETQWKAQREIDDLLQGRRLPDISDRENLVYVEAILLEVLRLVSLKITVEKLLIQTGGIQCHLWVGFYLMLRTGD